MFFCRQPVVQQDGFSDQCFTIAVDGKIQVMRIALPILLLCRIAAAMLDK